MNHSLLPAAVHALQQGRIIEAIKIVRTEHNLDSICSVLTQANKCVCLEVLMFEHTL